MSTMSSGPSAAPRQPLDSKLQQDLEQVFSGVLAALTDTLQGNTRLKDYLLSTFNPQGDSPEAKAKDLLGRFHVNFTTEFPKLRDGVARINDRSTQRGLDLTEPVANEELLTKVSFLALEPHYAENLKRTFDAAAQNGSGIDIPVFPSAWIKTCRLLAGWLVGGRPEVTVLGNMDVLFAPPMSREIADIFARKYMFPDGSSVEEVANKVKTVAGMDKGLFFLEGQCAGRNDLRGSGAGEFRRASLFTPQQGASIRPSQPTGRTNSSFDQVVEQILPSL